MSKEGKIGVGIVLEGLRGCGELAGIEWNGIYGKKMIDRGG